MDTTVYFASLYDRFGYLARINRAWTFLDENDDSTTEVDPPMYAFCTEMGEVHTAFVPAILARMRGCHEHLNCVMGS